VKIVGGQVGVGLHAAGGLQDRERILEPLGRDAVDDLPVHLDQSAV